jgi:predicted extracellular nuclease
MVVVGSFIMKSKQIVVAGTLLTAFVLGSSMIKRTQKNFFHNLKFNIPWSKIGLKIRLARTIVSATLEVKNNYYQNITVEGINMTVYIKNLKTKRLEELASTQPTPNKYVIQRNATTNISDIVVDVNNLALIKNGVSNVLNYQAGSKMFKVIISGYANGFPFNTETWY